jgi:xylan 1,4-beta-xylosidase
MYSSYTASSFARIYELMDQYQVNLKGAVSWSFEFEDQEWFAGFRDLATHGVDKPVLNVFRMFGMMSGQRIAVQSSSRLSAADIIGKGVRESNDIYALASMKENSLCVMLWNYHDDDVKGVSSKVDLKILGLVNEKVLVHHYRIDDQFSNSFEKWKSFGRPKHVNDDQYKQLERAGQLQLYMSPEWTDVENGSAALQFDLPRQGVSFIQLTW